MNESINNYLIIYGKNENRNLPCFSEQIIEGNELEKFKDIIKLIRENQTSDNWVWTIYLERKNKNEKFVEHHLIYDMYPNISRDILDDFGKLLPGGITRIESIKIYKGQKIKII